MKEQLKWHPFAEKFPLLEGEEREQFRAGISKTNGIKENPILYRLKKNGQKEGLDGRNRERECLELGIRPAMKRVRVRDADVKAFIIRQNLHRRMMTKEQRQAIVAELRADGDSTRQIAETLGVSDFTVRGDLKATGARNIAPDITGKDGKSYSATQPRLLPEMQALIDRGGISPKILPEVEQLTKNAQADMLERIGKGENPRTALEHAQNPREPGDVSPNRAPQSSNGQADSPKEKTAFDFLKELQGEIGRVVRADEKARKVLDSSPAAIEFKVALDDLLVAMDRWRKEVRK